MGLDSNLTGTERADSGWDDYAERVLRNEGRLAGLELLVSETREADGKLIEARSNALAKELERRADSLLELVTARADAVLALGKEERRGDRRELAIRFEEHDRVAKERIEAQQREGELALKLLREVYDTAIHQNYEQSREAIHALEQRRVAATDKVEQMVRQWRESDREARQIFAKETLRHLEQLNHNNERMSNFQANSVTRELWQSEKDAAVAREAVLREQIVALERTLVSMTPLTASDKAHSELRALIDKSVGAMGDVVNAKITTVDEKVADLRTRQDLNTGKSAGYNAFYGWAVAAIGLLITVIVTANSIFDQV